MGERIDRDDMFLQIATIVSERSTCTRASVGAVIVRDKRIISLGYNGAPPGLPHCEDVGCEEEEVLVGTPDEEKQMMQVEGCSRTVHAEANALAWAARSGVAVNESVMFCTHAPCYNCAKLMISAGIVACHYHVMYRDTRGVELLDRANVVVVAHT